MKNRDLFEELETERLILRKIVDDDAESLYKNIYNNSDYFKYYYQVPFNSFEEYKELVKKYKELYYNGNYFMWGIVLKETNDIIGIVQLHTISSMNNSCKIGYITGYRYTNKGYCIEATKKVIEFVFDKLKYHRIQADIVKENIPSIIVAQKTGMTFESVKEDAYKINDDYYDLLIYKIINRK